MRLSKQQRRNIDLKKRYQLFRALGFSSVEARKKSQLKSIDVSELKLVTKNNKTRLKNNRALKEFKIRETINNYKIYYKDLNYDKSKTVYQKWGIATHQQPIDEYTMETAKKVSKHYKEDLDWGYYYLYLSNQSGYDFDEMEQQLNKTEIWEKYRRKRGFKI